MSESAEALRSWRLGRDLSVEKAARYFDISKSFLEKIEGGLRRPALPLATKIQSMTDGAVRADGWMTDAAPAASEPAAS